MRTFMNALVAALVVGGTLTAAVPAEARPDGRWGYRGDHGRGWGGGYQGYRGGDRFYRGDRGYGGPRGYYGQRSYYAPRYERYQPAYGYGYGYDYPRYRYYGYDRGGDALIAGIAGVAIGAAIASGDRY